MALGGGIWFTQNKILPGSYLNFNSAARASAALSERGTAAIPVNLDFGALSEVVTLTADSFHKNSLKLFGHKPNSPALRPIRETLRHARTVLVYRLGSGGTAAAGTYATAKYPGKRGDAFSVVVQPNVDNAAMWDVSLYLDNNTLLDKQTVSKPADLVNNDFVMWNTGAALAQTAGNPLTGGKDPVNDVVIYEDFIKAVEGYSFNAIACPSTDSTIIGLFNAFVKDMRDKRGVKFQVVSYDNAADHEGIVNVMNRPADGANDYDLVYWTTGVIAGTGINASATNTVYDGEYTVDATYSQFELEDAIQAGKFAFHRVNRDVRVLMDINSLTTVTEDKNELFKDNQTIRVLDQIGNDVAVTFNSKYIGAVLNDEAGRVSFWADMIKFFTTLRDMRAIENFSDSDIKIEQGDEKNSVLVTVAITVINTMAKLYMSVIVQ